MSDLLAWVIFIGLLVGVPVTCIALSRRVGRQSSDDARGSAAAGRVARGQREGYKGTGWSGGPI
jgi:hypothetical protein